MNQRVTSTRRILFFAEAVTLAHVARPIVLAGSLDPQRYEAIVACSPRYQRFLDGQRWRALPLESISSERFLNALANGSPLYDVETLRGYVREDLRIIEAIQPDLVVGDFRLSLSVSCRLVRVPYAAITNTYWSPFLESSKYPLPVLPMTRFLPLAVARALFNLARPAAFALHCRPLNQVRAENGLASLGNDLRRVYTDADHTLYADVPGLFGTRPLPPSHHQLGPILWSPPQAKPPWWDRLPADRPIVYLTLGSSGHAATLDRVLGALEKLPVTVMASTAGATIPTRLASNIFIADYLPGTEAAARSALVICNGGSPTSQQALAAGIPVLGIASNMDQFLNMGALVAAGAGLLMRGDRLSLTGIRAAVEKMLHAPGFRINAAQLASSFDPADAGRRFQAFANSALACAPGTSPVH